MKSTSIAVTATKPAERFSRAAMSPPPVVRLGQAPEEWRYCGQAAWRVSMTLAAAPPTPRELGFDDPLPRRDIAGSSPSRDPTAEDVVPVLLLAVAAAGSSSSEEPVRRFVTGSTTFATGSTAGSAALTTGSSTGSAASTTGLTAGSAASTTGLTAGLAASATDSTAGSAASATGASAGSAASASGATAERATST